MTHTAKALLLIAGTILFGSGAANAATFTLTGGASDNLNSLFNPNGWVNANNNNVGIGSSIRVFGNGSSGGLTINESATLTFTYLGTEASYTDLSLVLGNNLFSNKTTGLGSQLSFNVSAGVVPLTFTVVDPGNYTAANGGYINPNLMIAFKKISDTRVYVFLEDIARNGDGDFDDMVIRIDISPNQGPVETPLPGAAWLFGTALAGAYSFRRKMRDRPRKS